MKTNIKTMLREAREGKDTTTRREAILALGYEKDPSVFAVLQEALDDPSTEIQHAAVIAFSRYGNAAAMRLLAKPKIFRSPSSDVRWAAVSAIGRLGSLGGVDLLVRAVSDEEWVVRDQAVSELKRVFAEVPREQVGRVIRIFMGLLELDNPDIGNITVDGLVAIGERSLDPLLHALKASSPVGRANAARALGRIGSPRAVPSLIQLLSDPDGRVRLAAVESLGRTDDGKSVEAVLAALQDIVSAVQLQAVRTLVGYGSLVVEPIHDVLRHVQNKSVFRAMLTILGEIGDPRSIPEIARYLSSTYFVVRIAAIKALVRFGERAIPELTLLLSINRSDVRGFLAEASGPGDSLSRIRAIRALAALEEHRAVETLKAVVEGSDSKTASEAEHALFRIGTAAWMRCSALTCLREIGHPSALPHVLRSLDDPSANVRLEAIRALGRVWGPGRVARLTAITQADPDPYLRAKAIAVLRQTAETGPGIVKAALRSLADKDANVRAQAAGLLGDLQNRRSIPLLVRALGDARWNVQESAENALQNYGADAMPALLRALRDKKASVRFRAARLCGELGGRSVLPVLGRIGHRKGEKGDVVRAVQEAMQKIRKRIPEA
jgi:HEAT repeat protein